MVKTVAWNQSKPPATAQQRVKYMESCQSWFTEISNQSYRSRPIKVNQQPSRPQAIANHFVDYEGASLFDTHTFECIVCGAKGCAVASRAAHIANPFSNWVVMACGCE